MLFPVDNNFSFVFERNNFTTLQHMKIGIIADPIDLQDAGIYYYTSNFITSLCKNKGEHTIYIFRINSEIKFTNCHEVVVPLFKFLPLKRYIRTLIQIPIKARELGLDLVIEPAHFGPFFLPNKTKRVTIIHDLTPILFPNYHRLLSSILHKFILPRILKRTDLILTNSNHSKSDICKYFNINSDKVMYLYPGIENIFVPSQNKRTLHRYGIYKKYFLFLGTLEPRKNLLVLIRAYELWREQNPRQEIQLILAGKKGWNYSPIIKAQQQSAFSDDIILLGYVERVDMPAIYSGSELFIYPSRYEGFGLPVLEALSCGCKVICSNSSSLPEVGAGFANYFNSENEFELCATIQSVKSSKRSKQEQLEYVKKFSWKETAINFLRKVEEI